MLLNWVKDLSFVNPKKIVQIEIICNLWMIRHEFSNWNGLRIFDAKMKQHWFVWSFFFSCSFVVIELVLIASAFSSIRNALPQTNSRFVYKTLRHSYRLLIFNQSCCFYSTAKLSTPIWLWVVYVCFCVCM